MVADNYPVLQMLYPQFVRKEPKLPNGKWFLPAVLLALAIMLLFFSKVKAEEIYLTASWYSIESLIKEGTWKNGKERRMANGKKFDENNYTCAVRGYPFGTKLKITNLANGLSVQVVVTDRISKRFAKTRIDLTPKAFLAISGNKGLKVGLLSVKVEKL